MYSFSPVISVFLISFFLFLNTGQAIWGDPTYESHRLRRPHLPMRFHQTMRSNAEVSLPQNFPQSSPRPDFWYNCFRLWNEYVQLEPRQSVSRSVLATARNATDLVPTLLCKQASNKASKRGLEARKGPVDGVSKFQDLAIISRHEDEVWKTRETAQRWWSRSACRK